MRDYKKITEDIYYIGKVDDRDVPFHRLVLTKGTTYNSYFIASEKPTVIDTVDMMYGREFVDNLGTLTDLEKIKYIVVNHTEPDHSGAMAGLCMKAKNATIVCSELAVDELKELYKLHNRKFLVVEDGDTLDIGGKTLLFKITPYLHTAETMITYCIEDKVLFPCDIFSTHVATFDLFDSLANEYITNDFIGYYNAIIFPHRNHVQTLLDGIKDLDIKIIAPSHGYVLTKDIDKYIKIYKDMSDLDLNGKKATVVYTTMRNTTKKIANLIKDELEKSNMRVSIFNADKDDKNEILKYISESNVVLFGSSTRYGDMIGNIESLLKELGNMNLEDKLAGAFGSYGWSGESIEIIQDYLNDTNMNVLNTSDVIKNTGMVEVEFPLRVRFSLDEDSTNSVIKAVEYMKTVIK
ncbi:FprA family A-type flavoprotein [Paraclostridium bifermentans]|uniref:FprA family A-type flavoprotein n=2 Tax=Paraclostridium bifermentans TaxID=1490 RepID=UPI00115AABEC|nr:FprA family A-type flavoprotein [Paraclostridium bifermentans]MCU9808534.1 FprA family A-type flavoprotein [Paraclostridium sp. AKS46]TQO55864.1 FprA family A-type flavoprotein [Paraclostridium bifermentans]GKZ06767.1 MBL fold hydrolase [Paraclostridium bifermentans]GKZ10354.1 MBL fold hydrolase [Paraclostridium bifermentans]